MSENPRLERLQPEADETAQIEREMLRYGVKLPRGEYGLWFDDSDERSGSLEEIQLTTKHYLTPEGKSAARKLIREEKRKNVEWWIKILMPLVGAVISILGLIVALISVSRK